MEARGDEDGAEEPSATGAQEITAPFLLPEAPVLQPRSPHGGRSTRGSSRGRGSGVGRASGKGRGGGVGSSAGAGPGAGATTGGCWPRDGGTATFGCIFAVMLRSAD